MKLKSQLSWVNSPKQLPWCRILLYGCESFPFDLSLYLRSNFLRGPRRQQSFGGMRDDLKTWTVKLSIWSEQAISNRDQQWNVIHKKRTMEDIKWEKGIPWLTRLFTSLDWISNCSSIGYQFPVERALSTGMGPTSDSLNSDRVKLARNPNKKRMTKIQISENEDQMISRNSDSE